MLTHKKGSPNWYAVLYAGGNKRRWVSTGTADKSEAKAIHDELAANLKTERRKKHISAILGHPVQEAEPKKATPIPAVWKRFLTIIPQPSQSQKVVFGLFAEWCKQRNIKTAEELSPALALEYLAKKRGKTFNTYKSGLSAIFRKCAIYGLQNPFAILPNRQTESRPYRALSDAEAQQLLKVAGESKDSWWRSAVLIGLYTGLRKIDIAHLQWGQVKEGAIELVPGKTAKYKRAVYIPLHPALDGLFGSMQRGAAGDYVLEEMARRHGTGAFEAAFASIMKAAGIADTPDGKASFHSLRATFITNCERSGIPRKVIQGIVGHRSPHMTEHYSQDRDSCRVLCTLPNLCKTS